jgi:hypothetical protein
MEIINNVDQILGILTKESRAIPLLSVNTETRGTTKFGGNMQKKV